MVRCGVAVVPRRNRPRLRDARREGNLRAMGWDHPQKGRINARIWHNETDAVTRTDERPACASTDAMAVAEVFVYLPKGHDTIRER